MAMQEEAVLLQQEEGDVFSWADWAEDAEPGEKELSLLEKNFAEGVADVKQSFKFSADDCHDILVFYKKEFARWPLLTKEQEIELVKRIQRGDRDAREVLICSNLRLVVAIVGNEYMYALGHLHFSDLVEEGNIGLIKAAERFKIEKGCRFSTYAFWWIRQSINRALSNHSRTIRLSVSFGEKARKVKKRIASLQYRGEDIDLQDIANEHGVSQANLLCMLDSVRDTVSLNAALGNDPDSCEFGDVKEDMQIPSPFEAIQKAVLSDDINAALDNLSEDERQILELGVVNDLKASQIAQITGIGLREVKMKFRGAISKMRQDPILEAYKEYARELE